MKIVVGILLCLLLGVGALWVLDLVAPIRSEARLGQAKRVIVLTELDKGWTVELRQANNPYPLRMETAGDLLEAVTTANRLGKLTTRGTWEKK